MNAKLEYLTTAADLGGQIQSDLRQALKNATELESILLLDAIRDAAALTNRLKQIAAAVTTAALAKATVLELYDTSLAGYRNERALADAGVVARR